MGEPRLLASSNPSRHMKILSPSHEPDFGLLSTGFIQLSTLSNVIYRYPFHNFVPSHSAYAKYVKKGQLQRASAAADISTSKKNNEQFHLKSHLGFQAQRNSFGHRPLISTTIKCVACLVYRYRKINFSPT